MYEVKKHDYNTVRFLPEYHSGYGNDFQHRQNKKKKRKRFALLILILLILIAAGALAVYKFFFSPEDQFSRAFSDSDFAACAEIFSENAYDDKFVGAVEAVVTDAADSAFQRYMNGEINSADVSQLLKNYNSASGEEFAEEINAYSDDIVEVENLKATYTTFQTQCSDADFNSALDTARQILSVTENHGLDYTQDIKSAVIERFYNFKAEAFRDIASALSARDYETADAICTFMLGCSSDQDFTDEQETIRRVVAGDMRASTAARQARNTASEAEAQAEKNDQADSSAGAEDNTSPEI